MVRDIENVAPHRMALDLDVEAHRFAEPLQKEATPAHAAAERSAQRVTAEAESENGEANGDAGKEAGPRQVRVYRWREAETP